MTSPADDPRVRRGIQAQLAARRKLVDAGAAPIGWKIGFGAPAVMAKLGITGPLVGFMTGQTRLDSGAVASLAEWKKPLAEAEIAVYMGRDLSGDASREEAGAAIAALGPAIELADLYRPPDDPEAILSGNIYHRYVVLGPRDDARAGGKIDGWTGHVIRNGHEVAVVQDLEANTGKILDLVAHVANVLASCGERLRKDEVIICGSVIPPIELSAEDETLQFRLAPDGAGCSVRFDRQSGLSRGLAAWVVP